MSRPTTPTTPTKEKKATDKSDDEQSSPEDTVDWITLFGIQVSHDKPTRDLALENWDEQISEQQNSTQHDSVVLPTDISCGATDSTEVNERPSSMALMSWKPQKEQEEMDLKQENQEESLSSSLSTPELKFTVTPEVILHQEEEDEDEMMEIY